MDDGHLRQSSPSFVEHCNGIPIAMFLNNECANEGSGVANLFGIYFTLMYSGGIVSNPHCNHTLNVNLSTCNVNIIQLLDRLENLDRS